ncbi:uracil-DNA glycosylase [Demequina sp. SYSU T00192]|uniref:Uracil-DNA glycosylase n=1 Tax=Demequina litoralis TaxID=3051660 RepID=A0ABT8G8M3_9MICO|nr:uracil-DNA glycosylase [Demequina sp. SYSU T00192]MDN4475490.1 uracil-DNA glycosylase [Demequina sp. SYSU T00192]
MDDAWRTRVAPDWAAALAPAEPTLAALEAFLRAEAAAGRGYLPDPDAVLRAFTLPLADVRVLLVGQDPYPTPGDPVGLSFSVPPDHPMPRSLRNVARELHDDTGEMLTSGDLSHWHAQGVMLLNRVLTVRPGEAGSHRRRGWEEVTGLAIEALAAHGGPLVAILWGNDARALGPLLGDVPRVESAHPSPLSASRGFLGSRPFSRVNRLLEEQGAGPIRWGTPAGDGLF